LIETSANWGSFCIDALKYFAKKANKRHSSSMALLALALRYQRPQQQRLHKHTPNQFAFFPLTVFWRIRITRIGLSLVD
jgi:hypothetical protein